MTSSKVARYFNLRFNLKIQTNFLSPDDKSVAATITPKMGRAIVFNHDTYHEGGLQLDFKLKSRCVGD